MRLIAASRPLNTSRTRPHPVISSYAGKDKHMLKALLKAITEGVPERRKAIYDDKHLWKIYKTFAQVGVMITAGFEIDDPVEYTEKRRLCCGLVLLGYVDALSQATHLSDRQFLALWDGFSYDAKLPKEEASHVLLYQQRQVTSEPAFQLILAGGQAFVNSARENFEAILAVSSAALAAAEKPQFPTRFIDL